MAAAREEKIVDEIACRRLITISALVDGLRWTTEPHDLAEHLWVDTATLHTRLSTLDPIEVSQLEYALEDLWIP